jgi:hypothetical protein
MGSSPAAECAIDRPYCGGQPGPPFVVTAGKTLLGVIVWIGCDIS